MSVHRNTTYLHKLLRAYILIALSIAYVTAIKAMPPANARDSVDTYFKLDKSYLDSSYRQNAEMLDSCFSALSSNTPLRISRISVIGAASPEGNSSHNFTLSANRAASLISYIARYGLLPDSLISVSAIGGDFAGLRDMVKADMALPGRTEALAALDANDGKSIGRLKKIDGGLTYQYMRQNMFPDLRKTTLIVEYEIPRTAEVEAKIADLPPFHMPVAATDSISFYFIPVSTTQEHRPPRYMALKTNMLYDLAAVPNISFEYYIGRNWSVSADWLGAWWSQNSRHRYWRIYGGTLTARRWFGGAAAAKPLTGHHVGVYAGALTYDLEWDGDGYMGGLPHGTILDRCMLVGGVEYGYSLPVARRLNIDFTIGIGYFGGKYIKYSPMYGHYYKDSETKLRYFGPTRAEVSLVWLLGHGNRNR